MCPCNAREPQTEAHFLQSCPLYTDARKDVWPTGTPVEDKLLGILEQLQKIGDYIRRIQIAI